MVTRGLIGTHPVRPMAVAQVSDAMAGCSLLPPSDQFVAAAEFGCLFPRPSSGPSTPLVGLFLLPVGREPMAPVIVDPFHCGAIRSASLPSPQISPPQLSG